MARYEASFYSLGRGWGVLIRSTDGTPLREDPVDHPYVVRTKAGKRKKVLIRGVLERSADGLEMRCGYELWTPYRAHWASRARKGLD